MIQRTDDRITRPCHGRYLADHLAHARYLEQPGDDVVWLADTDAMLAEIQEFLTGGRQPPEPDRVLATILLTDIVASTTTIARIGDQRWHALLETHTTEARRRGEILVSRTVKDLIAGSEISFIDRGPHKLSGVPDTWDLFAVNALI